MRNLGLALSLLLGLAPAQAQNFTMPPPAGVTVGGYVVVASCGAQSLSPTQGFGTMDETGKICVAATVSQSPPSPAAATNCSGTITAGGAAQNAIAASTITRGFFIANIDASAGSGEPLWVSFSGTAAAGAAGSYPLTAPAATTFTGMGSFTSPDWFISSTAVSIVGATTGHKFSCTYQ